MSNQSFQSRNTCRVFVIALASLVVSPALAELEDGPNPQPNGLRQRIVDAALDSGWVANSSDSDAIVFESTVGAADAPWVRLQFETVTLGVNEKTGEAALLQITSLDDGAVQVLDEQALAEWQNTSAYFNGNAVHIEIIAPPASTASRLQLREIMAGEVDGGDAILSICGATDDRLPSQDPRVARILPVICTVWLIDDCAHCFASAGHCAGGFQVAQFNVPLSNNNGSINHPGPEDQYPVDPSSLQLANTVIGNDWAYFGTFDNSTTGLSPAEAQMDWFTLSPPPNVAGQQIRITGYGVVSSPVPLEWDQAQKTHVGPYVSRNGTRLTYRTDTTGSNSGSPVIEEGSGHAIGVHTNAGCNVGGGANSGTGSDNAGWQAALANPRGVCCEGFGPDDFVPGVTNDCDNDNIADSCEIAAGAEPDCNGNRVPDSCDIASGDDPDCDGNGLPDSCDIAAGNVTDCNANGVPDSCEVAAGAAADCNNNGFLDACELVSGLAVDCDGNGVLDSCEIAAGDATDCNENGQIDACDIGPDFVIQSPGLGPIGTGSPQTFEFSGLSEALGAVAVDFVAQGDFNLASENIEVMLGGMVIGTALVNGFADCAPQSDMLMVDASTFNSLVSGGAVEIVMTATAGVNPALCPDGSFVRVSLSYLIESRDQNGNGILDECESLLLGDMNCDGAVTVSDIGPFVLAITNPDGYALQFPDCDILAADFTNDGTITVSDIGGFVAAVAP